MKVGSLIHLLDTPFVIPYALYISFPVFWFDKCISVNNNSNFKRRDHRASIMLESLFSLWTTTCDYFCMQCFQLIEKDDNVSAFAHFFLIFVCFKFFFLFSTSNLTSSVKVMYYLGLCHCFVWSLPLELLLSASGNWQNFHILWFSKFLCFVKCKWIITLVHSVVNSLLVWI